MEKEAAKFMRTSDLRLWAIEEEKRLSKCVNAFARAMKKKLVQKIYEGYSGWDDPKCKEGIAQSLWEHAQDQKDNVGGEEIDIANLAMMLWNLNKKEKHGRD